MEMMRPPLNNICRWTNYLSQPTNYLGAAVEELMERRKITFEDPVVDYIPQMANPVILEDEVAENLVYTPAKNVIRVKHLLNFTGGMFYPPKGITKHAKWMDILPCIRRKTISQCC
jgi:hypothetical protein